MNVLIINGHPDRESLETSVAIAYRDAALHAANNVDEITIAEIPRVSDSRNFEEYALDQARKKIVKADHLVWVHPAFSSGFPAGTAIFTQMLFHRKKIYKGKTSRLIVTLDQPGLKFRLLTGRRLINKLKKEVLEKTGIYNIKVTNLGCTKQKTKEEESELLRNVAKLGQQLG